MPFIVKDGVIIDVNNYSNYEKWPDTDTIGSNAFNNTFIYELIVPETIKKIEPRAFTKIKARKITLPKSLQNLGELTFIYNNEIREVVFNGELKGIPNNAFTGCSALEKIKLPKNLEIIEKYAYANCSSLKNINLPNTLKVIDDAAFNKCTCLNNIQLPSSLEKIGRLSFLESGLTEINIPQNVSEVGEDAFFKCFDLKKVDMRASNVTKLNNSTFNSCSSLKKVLLSKNLESIGEAAFSKCNAIEELDLPKSIAYIGKEAFNCCSSLKQIKLPNIERIERGTFCNCYRLNNVDFPTTLCYIGDSAFENCDILKKIDLSNTKIKQIGNVAFSYCTSLEEIKFPDTLEKIGQCTFSNCNSISNITLPKNLKIIDNGAFIGCNNIRKFVFPDGLKYIGNEAFFECYNLNEVHFPKGVEINSYAFSEDTNYKKVYCYDIDKIANKSFIYYFINNDTSNIYLNDKTGEYLIASKDAKDIPNNFRILNELDEYKEKLNCNNTTAIILYKSELKLDELKERNLLKKDIYSKIIEFNYQSKLKDIYNTKEFLSMIQRKHIILDNNEIAKDYFKLAFNLGAFNSSDIVRQKACNYIENLCDKGILKGTNVHSVFDSMKIDGYNKEWAEFFMNKENLEKLLESEKNESGFIAKTYNDFYNIKEFSRSNRGNQHYKKVTVEACKEYFSKVAFSDVDEETMDISTTISSFTRHQESFNLAKKIRKEYIENREKGLINDHILKEELKENDVFNQIDNVRGEIIDNTQVILDTLSDVSSKKFSYEFLSKYDPRNFVLGKYCCCCAHLDGAGVGIMKASILHPDCQNLIIKDSNGKIIAKSTLYINREKGYGVFNNVEVNTNANAQDLELIYNKYKKAINDFVTRYNEIYDKKITKINVGMHLNDLGKLIRENDEEGNILQGIDFSMYGVDDHLYKGDWQEEQYVLWKKK